MQIILLSDNPIYTNVLQHTLEKEEFFLKAYSIKTLEECDWKDADLAILILDENNKSTLEQLNINVPIFVIRSQNINLENNPSLQIVRYFSRPVRLGHVHQQIKDYCKQQCQKKNLQPVQIGSYMLHAVEMQLRCGNDDVISLTDKERDILLYLAQANGSAVSRQDLLDNVWKYASDAETHTLETHIYRLRQKIETIPSQPDFLMINDDGYYLNF